MKHLLQPVFEHKIAASLGLHSNLPQDDRHNYGEDTQELFTVKLAMYDISQGLASQHSQMLLGKHIDGIWHTSLIVYGKEYYFGKGICYNLVGNTPFGKPTRVVDLGETRKSEERFYEGLD
jgi:hypothetical protein